MPAIFSKYFFYFLLNLVFLFSVDAYAQVYNFKNYTVDSGFPAAQPIEVFQDDKGFLWICTLGEGLTRFDGVNYKHYNYKDSLISNEVRAIVQDNNGVFWIGTEEGLSKFNGSSFETIKNKLFEHVSIRDILIDKKGKLWIGTYGNGLITYDHKVFTQFEEKDGLLDKKISSIAEDKKGNIWLGTITGGLFKYDGTAFTQYTIANGLSNNTVRSVIADKDNRIWIGTDNGLTKFENEEFTIYRTPEGLIHNLVYDVCEDKLGNIWIGTLGGISKFDNQKFKSFTTAQGLTSNLVYNLFIDKEGNMWIGTDLPGITVLGVHQISYYTQKTGLSNNSVYGITQDNNGNFWFATYGGANIYNGEKFEIINETALSPTSNLLSVSKDREGVIWFTGTEGVIKFDGKDFKKLDYSFSNNPIFSLRKNISGETWFGSKGLIRYDGQKTFKKFDFKNSTESTIFSIHEDSRGYVWLATGGQGAIVFDGENFSTIDSLNGLPSSTITSIAEDKQGNIWLGTDGKGVCKLQYQNKGFDVEQVFDTRVGLIHNAVQALIFDNTGHLWVGTKNGICEIDVPEYNQSKRKIITNFGRDEGFISVECNQNAVFKDKEGFLWFGTEGGAIRFNPATEPLYNKSLRTYISNVRLFYEDVDWGKYSSKLTPYFNLPTDLKLSHDNNYLTFDFIGIHFSNPNKVRYQFRLTPADEEWLPVTNKNDATYSNLSPGKYTFEVRATTNGSWISPTVSFDFSIEKPFWKTWWFFSLMILMAIGLIYGYISSHTRTLKVIQKDLEVKVQQRTYQLEEQNNKLQDAYKIIEEKNSEITDSIRYAKNIQEAILPPMHLLKNFLPDSFVFFMPKDIVSGDFYWLAQTETKVVVAAVDCTGHGVPGAFMSFVGFNLLNQIVNQSGITTPSEILNNLNISLNESLRNTLKRSDIKDGMDIAICTIDIKDKLAEFSGAYNPLYHIRDKHLTIFPADRFPVGSFMEMSHKKFTNHTIQLLPGDSVYIFTDGFADQFGGPDDKKFMYSRFRNLLVNIQDLNMTEQKLVLYKEFQNWKGINEQVDDILVIGIRV
ncbi:MAG TPA: two-component regulator propeller domain-containing protein [Cytophagales bacterium]|nr:two-component regulator propeller domain-containing protein [Cytophagales bacterium]